MAKRLNPDPSPVLYTVQAWDQEAYAIARGELPPAIQNAMIGLLLLMGMNPEQRHWYDREKRAEAA